MGKSPCRGYGAFSPTPKCDDLTVLSALPLNVMIVRGGEQKVSSESANRLRLGAIPRFSTKSVVGEAGKLSGVVKPRNSRWSTPARKYTLYLCASGYLRAYVCV